MEVLLAYHRHTVEGLILVMILNILIPYFKKPNYEKIILFSRIGFFLFWTLWSMVVFTGIIILVFKRMSMTQEVWFMIVLVYFYLPLMGYRSYKNL